MFEIINHSQTFLYSHNKPPSKSFYDQMMTNRQKEHDEKQRETEELERKKLWEEDREVATRVVMMRVARQYYSHQFDP